MAMLRSGWATTYEGAGAEYGAHTKEYFLKVEGRAKRLRRGIWAGGVEIESPAEYKKRYAVAEVPGKKRNVEKLEEKIARRFTKKDVKQSANCQRKR